MCTGIAILLHLFLEHLLCQEEITMLEYIYQYYIIDLKYGN